MDRDRGGGGLWATPLTRLGHASDAPLTRLGRAQHCMASPSSTPLSSSKQNQRPHACQHLLNHLRPVLQDFYEAHSCCLDEFFSEPFKIAYPSIDSIDEPAWRCLSEVGRRCNVANMRLENLLSHMKAAVRHGDHTPTIETLGYVAELSALMKDHLARGAKHHVVQSRSAMQQDGVPLEANRSLAAKRRARPKAHVQRRDMSWMNLKYIEWKRCHPGATPEARRDFFTRTCAVAV